ncbi:Cytochrome monooxygenase aneD like protein [Verticillium longisporum]
MFAGQTTVALLAGLVAVAFLAIRKSKPAGKATPLKLPLTGDLHSSPRETPLVYWDAWARKNGPIATPKLFGIVPMVVLNTAEAATELLSRRSQWYSNRLPSTSMEMITGAGPGQSRFTLMHDYDAHLKLHHRLLSPSLGAVAAPRYQPVMELESKQLLFDLVVAVGENTEGAIANSSDVYPLLERTQSSVILLLHYGLRIPDVLEPILDEIIDIQTQVTHIAANPRLPDFIPPLRNLPAMLSPWKRAADKLFATQVDLYGRLYEHGKSSPGWNATKQVIATAKKVVPGDIRPADFDLDIAFTLATSIQGGMETSPRQILWLFVAALQNPGFVRRAHAVLDDVVGRDRLPRFADRSRLAFIDAVIHELFRWRPVSPGSIPRRADKEDEFAGVKIVRNATIIANAWGIGRDEAAFDPGLGDLQAFIPERWLDGQGKVNSSLPLPVFGQGRRACMGRRVAVDGTFMQVANLLWAFDVEASEEVDPWAMSVVGFMTVPTEFRFKLKPRGPWVLDVITRSWEDASKDLGEVMGLSHDVEG